MRVNQTIQLCIPAFTLAFLQNSTVLGQGNLTPPGAPAPTMKTLEQIEARTPISTAPFTITVPGSYYLATNLVLSGGDAINIATNGVTLDLNGFVITSTVLPAAGTGIQINSGLQNIVICNGIIRGGATNNGSGVFSGPGFAHGIREDLALPVAVRISGVTVTGCTVNGISLAVGNAHIVESCTVSGVGGVGIAASTVRNCIVTDCGGSHGILANQVSDSRSECHSGTGISAETVINSFGRSATSGSGIVATLVQNSRGVSQSGTGLQAYEVAINSQGVSTTGTAVLARNAAFCVGTRPPGGTVIEATIANGCFPVGGTNLITHKFNMP